MNKLVGIATNNFNYRYGFNGKEKDNTIKGQGNSYDYGNRMYDSRLGRFLSVDAAARATPYSSPYVFVGDNPINYIDGDGNFKIRILGFGKGVHERITKVAFEIAKASGNSVVSNQRKLVHGVRRADLQSLAKDWFGHEAKEYHFDNIGKYSEAVAGWNKVQGRINGANGNNDLGYGYIAHTVQDFYAHSNYVEIASKYFDNYTEIPLFDEVMNNEDAYPADFVADLKANLHSGKYGDHNQKGKPEYKTAPDSHGVMNKDLGMDAPLQENSNKDINSFMAEQLAIKATVKLFTGGRFTGTKEVSSPKIKKKKKPKRHKSAPRFD